MNNTLLLTKFLTGDREAVRTAVFPVTVRSTFFVDTLCPFTELGAGARSTTINSTDAFVEPTAAVTVAFPTLLAVTTPFFTESTFLSLVDHLTRFIFVGIAGAKDMFSLFVSPSSIVLSLTSSSGSGSITISEASFTTVRVTAFDNFPHSAVTTTVPTAFARIPAFPDLSGTTSATAVLPEDHTS